MNNLLEIILDQKTQGKSPAELELGWLRYETLRTFSPNKYAEFHKRNLAGENFDAMIDAEALNVFGPEKPAEKDEEILCFYRRDVHEHIALPVTGIIEIQPKTVQALFDAKLAFFNDRKPAETDPNKKQIIPYCVCTVNGKFLRYTRGKSSGESRLHAKKSIGIGGHVNPIDQSGNTPTYDTYIQAVRREIQEEIGVTLESVSGPIALINDESNDVGSVHLGAIHLIELKPEEAKAAEAAIENLEEVTLETLLKESGSLETWSQLIANHPTLLL